MRPTHPSTLAGAVAAVGAVALGAALALAQDRPERAAEGSVDAALASIAAAGSAVSAWAEAEGDTPLRREVLADAAPETSGAIARKPGLALDAAAQALLVAEEIHYGEVVSKLAQRRRGLVSGEADSDAAGETPELLDASFDVLAICSTPSDYPAPVAGLTPALTEASNEALRAAPRTRGVDADNLTEVVRTILDNENGSSVAVENGVLYVRASAPSMARIRALVALFREATTPRVGLDVRAYRITRDLFRELDGLRETGPGLALSPEGERVLGDAVVQGRAQLLAGQTLVARDGQVVHAWRGETRTYVGSVETNQTGICPVLNPFTRRLNTGLMAELRPVVDPTGTSVTVNVLFSLSEVPGPVERLRICGFDVELPQVSVSRTGTTLAIPFGRGVLIGGSFAAPAAKPGEKPDDMDVPLASVLYVKPTLVAGGAARVTARPGPAPPHARAPGPRPAVPQVSLSAEAKAEVERLSTCLAVLEPALERIRQARVVRWELIDVRDLLNGKHDLVFGELGLKSEKRHQGGAGSFVFGDEPTEDPGEGAITPDRIVEMVREMTGDDEGWGDPAYIAVHRGSLLVRNTPGTLANLHAALASFRQERSGLVQLEAGFYRLEPALLAELEAAAAADGSTGGAIPGPALVRLDDAVAKGEGAAFLGGGFLVARSGERVYLHEGLERAYVSDFETSSGGTSTIVEKVAQPIVGVLRTGFKLDVRVTEDPESRRKLSVEASVSRAKLRGIGKSETPNGPIETPAIDMDEANASVTVVEGHGVLVVTHGAPGKTGVVALVLRPRGF
jgi:hypothetical protein